MTQVLLEVPIAAAPLKPTSRLLASCLEKSQELWAEHKCFPLPYLSDISFRRMENALRELSLQCLAPSSLTVV